MCIHTLTMGHQTPAINSRACSLPSRAVATGTWPHPDTVRTDDRPLQPSGTSREMLPPTERGLQVGRADRALALMPNRACCVERSRVGERPWEERKCETVSLFGAREPRGGSHRDLIYHSGRKAQMPLPDPKKEGPALFPGHECRRLRRPTWMKNQCL